MLLNLASTAKMHFCGGKQDFMVILCVTVLSIVFILQALLCGPDQLVPRDQSCKPHV